MYTLLLKNKIININNFIRVIFVCKKLNFKNINEMAKNIADFFGEKKQDKTKCKNIFDFDFVNEQASNNSPEKLTKQDGI